LKVLIVDDRREDRVLLRCILEHHGWQVLEAGDGLEALEQLRRERPGLVISDALMPKMDGFSLLRAMKKDPALAATPFVFHTATYTGQHENELALSLGAAGVLVKPLTPDIFWQELSAIMATLSPSAKTATVAEPPVASEKFLEKYSSMVASKLEEKVRELEQIKERWEKTFDAMHTILTIQDTEMHITLANKTAGDCFKTTPQALIGRHCYELFRGSREPCPNCPVFQTIQDGGYHSQVITHESLGKIFHVTSAPILDRDQHLDSLVHAARDISEVRRLEGELFQAQKMEAIGTLAGGIAHDFNNILSPILGYTELAIQKMTEGQLPIDDLEEVLTAGRRAKDLVRQILTVSRKGKHEVGPMAPYPLVKEALKLLRSGLPSTIEIQQDIDPACGMIMADPTTIYQIVVNLCTNAFQAMEDEKGTLTVTLKRVELTAADLIGHDNLAPGPYLELMVKDTGSGISEEILPHIFEPYFTTKASGKGTGLGLAVVFSIVRNLDGMIKVESVLGQGSTFRAYFQALAAMNGDNKASLAERAKPASGCERIMVVDDDQMITTMLDMMLEELGYIVTPFLSGREALAAFTANPDAFDLLLTDQTMPGLTGADLAREVLRLRPDIPIILCTGYSSMLSEAQAKELGLKHYLTKPVEIHVLATAIREALNKRK
jgi:two-component system cell cycle sensor histidine kinase/response regulator CckA